ncbi:ATP-binding protein [Bordetella sp. 15P40C-2]|uniref:hybrid sensor histidine kinase/response regulator n=1 Tax=Bordetella sp. 15P40C-2 TaxID=2572246 RepID=UPI001324D32A|nr:ATP-binding protein [Bordetella sp. 15P40C-2]MVW72534.1 transporter substrate-binding domain-containing protein [Bordetella sp. 15P40C-2]
MNRSLLWSIIISICAVAAVVLVRVSQPDREPTSHGLETLNSTIHLSAADRNRLRDMPVIRVGYVPDWRPLSFLDGDEVSGIAGEYLRILTETLGMRVELVKADSMMDLQSLMLKNEVDLIPLMSPYHSAGRRFLFSEPYLMLPEVFVTRSHPNGPDMASALAGKVILTAAPELTQQKLRNLVPGASIYGVANAIEGLDLVRDGHADAYVGNVAVVDALIRGRYQFSLQIAGQAGTVLPLSVAVSERYAWLMPLVDRTLDAIPDTTRRQILNSWTAVVYDPSKVNWRRVAETLLPAGLAAALILSALFFAFVKYRREALQRREAEAKLNAVTRHLPAVVFQARKEGADDLAFDYVSGNSADIWGLEPETMRANPWLFLESIDERDLDSFLAAQKQAVEKFEPFLLEFRVRRDGQTLRWIRGNAVPTRSVDGAVVWCGYWVDISDIKLQSVELQLARDAAEQAAQSKAHFLATMSHEIRTPLNGVIGMLELIRRSELPPEQASMLATIDDSASNLRRLLDEILDISKIEAGHLQLDIQPVDLRAIAADVVLLFNASAVSKGLSLTLRVDQGVPWLVRADALRLRQILSNLVSNAIKFTNEGEVAVSITGAAALAGADMTTVRVMVTDTGIGLGDATAEELFAPYTQGPHGHDAGDAPSGTGLGLSICRRIADAMGGEITLRAGPQACGAQATLTLNLPIEKRALIDSVPYAEIYFAIDDAETDQLLHRCMEVLGCTSRVRGRSRAEALHDASWIEFACHAGESALVVRASDRAEAVTLHIDESLLQWRELLACLQGHDSDSMAAPATQTEVKNYAYDVLVAEDHDVSRRLLVSQLQKLGCNVTACEDGEQAWQFLIRGGKFDVLITDGHMPRLGGLALLKRLRESDVPALRQLPVLLLSATPLPVPETPAGSKASTALLLKPAKIKDFSDAFNKLAAQPPAIASNIRVSDSVTLPRETVLEFVEAIRADQSVLEKHLAADDRHAMRRWVHRQAGPLAILGLNELTDQAENVERALDKDHHDAIAAVIAFNQSLSELIARVTASAGSLN